MRVSQRYERWEGTTIHLTWHCRVKAAERHVSELDIERTVRDAWTRWPGDPGYGAGRFVHRRAGLEVVTGTPSPTGDVDVITTYWPDADGCTGGAAA